MSKLAQVVLSLPSISSLMILLVLTGSRGPRVMAIFRCRKIGSHRRNLSSARGILAILVIAAGLTDLASAQVPQPPTPAPPAASPPQPPPSPVPIAAQPLEAAPPESPVLRVA